MARLHTMKAAPLLRFAVLLTGAASCRPSPGSASRERAVTPVASSAPVALATPSARVAVASPLQAVPSSAICVANGHRFDSAPADRRLHIDQGGLRAFIAGDHSAAAEIAFTYRGPSRVDAPLANGELRRQIGLKLRAQDTCNVVYVMWHVEPATGVAVSVKRNESADTHRECGAAGYINVQPEASKRAPVVLRDVAHVLRAELTGQELRVTADDVVVWRGRLPAAAFAFDGPAGIRSDNGAFDLELRVPGGADPAARCGQ